jgi:hypothetical protein
MSIPLYSYEFALLDFISEKRALRLENAGLAKLVRRKGHLNRVVLYRRPGDPNPTTVRQYMGTGYSFEQPLGDYVRLGAVGCGEIRRCRRQITRDDGWAVAITEVSSRPPAAPPAPAP